MVLLEVTEHFNWPLADFDGPWAAVYTTANDSPWTVSVYDMRTGRVRFEDQAIGQVDTIALAPDGAIAWIEDNGDEVMKPSETVFRVREHNHFGTFTLDRGPAIAPSSLVRRGATVRWRDGASQRSGPLR
ncbi:MAG TPA: hypothetical protein VN772_05735 [Solirubrobacteraceae bacterium]|nr:hypothetical protein [Solirubrobacteraceae bacterium]